MSSIKIIAEQFALQTRLFNNVLDGLEESQGGWRITDSVNHLQWIAGHLVNARYNYAPMLGIRAIFPHRDLYVDPTMPPPGNRSIDSSLNYPALSELKRLWNEISPKFVETLYKLDDAQLNRELSFDTPIRDNSMLGLLGFLSSHESSHIGQMSIIRRFLGLKAMTYN
ncbi:MAG TPA: DinB family protein [Puia sp.]|nr:DinB family protein [Puia sp.]